MITGSEICLGTQTTLLDTVTMATVWIVCRSTQCERDRAGIRVHLHWKAKEFFGKMQGICVMYRTKLRYVRTYSYTFLRTCYFTSLQPTSSQVCHGAQTVIQWLTFNVSCTICDLQYLRYSLLVLRDQWLHWCCMSQESSISSSHTEHTQLKISMAYGFMSCIRPQCKFYMGRSQFAWPWKMDGKEERNIS